MSQIIQAVYEAGVLRPLKPLNLPEKQRVNIQIWAEEPESKAEREEILRLMIDAGLMRPSPKPGRQPAPLYDRERRALAEQIGRIPGKSISDIVIEDRGEI